MTAEPARTTWLRAIVEAIGAPCGALDDGGRWVAANRELHLWCGAEPSTLLGRTLDELVGEGDRQPVAEVVGLVRDGQRERGEYRLSSTPATWAVATARIDVSRIDAPAPGDREPRYCLVMLQDDAEQLRKRTQLRVSERALQAAASGIVICDARDERLPMTYVNTAFEKLTGYRAVEVLGRNCRFLNDQDRHQPGLKEVRDALRERRETTVTLRNFRKDGTAFWNELTISPVEDHDGEVTHFIGIQDDITDRMEFAAERERLLAESLSQQERAERAAKARDTLLAVVSHELRSPLNGIRLWASVLQGGDLSDRELIQRAVDQIDRGVTLQSRIIEDLLDVSRFESGRLELRRRRLDLVGVVTSVIERNRPIAGERGIELVAEFEAERAVVRADRQRLEQVLQNLIDNAIKFSDRGGAVRVAVTLADERVRVAVRDDGIGIPEDQLPSVFEQYWQASGRDARTHGGLGLGLNLVKHIVEHHDGAVEAFSEGRGRGATLTFWLPLQAGRAAGGRARAVSSSASPRDAGGEMLVVDDDHGTVEALALGLRMQGYEVRIARSVDEALQALSSHRPRALVSDLMMGDRTGFELVAALRDHEFDKQLTRIPAIAISGRAGHDDERAARVAGFDAYLTKPVRLQVLASTVSAALAAGDERAASKVLVVHPDREFGERLRGQLLTHGHSVQLATVAADALAIVDADPVEVVIAAAEFADGTGKALLDGLKRDHVDALTMLEGPAGAGRHVGMLRRGHVAVDLADGDAIARILFRWGGVVRMTD